MVNEQEFVVKRRYSMGLTIPQKRGFVNRLI